MKERDRTVDLLRGLGILFMIMGHIGFGSRFDLWIHGFHMPLFFVISGYFFTPDAPLFAFVKKKAKSLLLPYILFAFFHLFLACFLIGPGEVDLLSEIKDIFLSPNIGRVPIAGALWFLPVLFFAEMLFYLLSRLTGKRRILLLCLSILLGIGGMVLSDTAGFHLPLGLDTALACIGFLGAGYTLRTNRETKTGRALFGIPLWLDLLLLVAGSILVFLNGYVNFRIGRYRIIPLTFVNAVLMTVLLWNLAGHLVKTGIFAEGLGRIGRNSLIYLCLNELCILAFSDLFGKIFSGFTHYHPTAGAFVTSFFILLFTCLILTLLSYLWTHLPRERVLLFAVIAILFVFFMQRLFYGGSADDELWNLTESYRLASGDRFLTDIWDNYQTGQAFLAPFVFLYRAVRGSLSGIVLASRFFYLCLNLLAAALIGLLLRKRFDLTTLLGFLSLFVFFAPFSLYYLWYDTAGILFFTLGAVLLFEPGEGAEESADPKKAFFAGIFHALMCMAYPTAILVVFAELVALFFRSRKKPKKKLLFYCAGGASVAAILLLYVLVIGKDNLYLFRTSSGTRAAAAASEDTPSVVSLGGRKFRFDPSEIAEKVGGAVKDAFGLIFVSRAVRGIYILLLGIASAGRILKKKFLLAAGILGAGILPLAAVLLGRFTDNPNRTVLSVYLYFVFLLPFAFLSAEGIRKKNRDLTLFGIAPSAVFFLVIAYTALHGDSKCSLGLSLAGMLSVLLYIAGIRGMFAEDKPVFRDLLPACMALLFASLVLVRFYGGFFGSDAKRTDMTVEVTEGLQAGLRIAEEDRVLLDEEERIHALLPADAGSVALIGTGNGSYLAAEKRVLVPSVYSVFPKSAKLLSYWEACGYPDCILISAERESYEEIRDVLDGGLSGLYEKAGESDGIRIYVKRADAAY